MLTKYGYNTIGVMAVISAVLIIISFYFNNTYIKVPFILAASVLIIFTLNFFRDPDRNSPSGDNIIISPADGKVMLIKDVVDNRYINGNAKQISIFMSPFNVHVNRIPIDGKVEYVNYVDGEYLVAYHDKADEKNERSEIGILSRHGKVLFTQVAGFVARRIVYEIKEGDLVSKGNRFGMIKFGSRVDVLVPPDWEIKVKEGQMVAAGESILFEIGS